MPVKIPSLAKTTIRTLAHEVGLLRSLIIASTGISQDAEGEYRPEFVEEMLRVSTTSQPAKEFTGAKNFLRRFKKK